MPGSIGPNPHPGNRRHIMASPILVILAILAIHIPGNNVLDMTNRQEMYMVRIMRGID